MTAIQSISEKVMAESGTNHTLAHFVYEGEAKIMNNKLNKALGAKK